MDRVIDRAALLRDVDRAAGRGAHLHDVLCYVTPQPMQLKQFAMRRTASRWSEEAGGEKYFPAARGATSSSYPAPRARFRSLIDNLFTSATKTPLTRLLAGVQSRLGRS